MKKFLCLLFAIVCIANIQSKAQTILFEDFTTVTAPALPAGWTNTFTAVPGTTPVGWVTITAAADYFFNYSTPPHGQYAECTEYYNTGNDPADLTSPSFSLAGATSPHLSFDFLFNGSHYYYGGFGYFEEGYVKLSTDGGTTWHYLDTLPVGGYWDHRFVDLSAYAGSPNCKISFEYTDSGGTLFGFLLTNVRVYNEVPYELGLTSIAPLPGTANFATTTAGVTISGVVTNFGSNTITDFTTTYQGFAAAPVVSTFSGLSIAPTQSYTFTCTTPYIPTMLDSTPVAVWINTAGDTTTSDDTLITGITGVTHFPNKIPVAEEATATWCNTCPYGIIAFDSMYHSVHNAISLIATHCRISTIDPMEDGWSSGWMMSQVPSTPYMIFDRKYKTTPDQVSSLYNQHHNDFGYADIYLSYTLNADTTVTVAVSVLPATNLHGHYMLSVVLTEDYVHSSATPSSWDQANSYSGGSSSGVTDGYYNFNLLPDPVPATYMYYNHVDRRVFPGVYGGNYLPSPMAAGTYYSHGFNIPMGYWWKTANMHAIAILMDSTTGYVLNSGNINFGPDTMTLPPIPLRVIDDPMTGNIIMSPNPATTSFTISAGTIITSVEIADVLGHTVFSGTYNDPKVQVSIATLSPGMYLVKINGSEIRKFVKQ